MKDFVEYLVKNIVSKPELVDIRQKIGEQKTLVEIRVAAEDIGKVVGKKGKVIQSLRTLVMSIGMRLGQKVLLEVIQEEERTQN